MFPFDHGEELSFQAAGNNLEDHEEEEAEGYQQQDLVPDNELLAAVNLYTTPTSFASGTLSFSSTPDVITSTAAAHRGRGRGRGRGRRIGGGPAGEEEEDDRRKTVHRDIERQRRQEMSSLYSNLRSLLPLHCLKGKRSMSDHIAESVGYIKHLEESVKDLGDRRDQLRRLSTSHGEGSHSSSSAPTCSVEVFMGTTVLEVQISSAHGEDEPLLSRALKVLAEARLDVVSCVTNKLNQGLIHNIHCQVTPHLGSDGVGAQQLQQRLYEALSSNTSN